MGFKSVMIPGDPHVEDYDSPCYAPLWEAAIDLDLPISFHILTSKSDDLANDRKGRGPKINSFMQLIRGNQDIMGMLCFGGVFERHPKLKVVCVEADAGWVPHFTYRMDHAYHRHRFWMQTGGISRPPSEFFYENIYVTYQDDFSATHNAEERLLKRIMWANDFPHSDSTWPWSQSILEKMIGNLDQEATRLDPARQCRKALRPRVGSGELNPRVNLRSGLLVRRTSGTVSSDTAARPLHRAVAIGSVIALGLFLALGPISCAGRPSAESVSAALVGVWENLDAEPRKASSAAGAVANTVGIHAPPWAATLEFEARGHFEARYPSAELSRLHHKLGGPPLESPLRGTWRVKRDLAGVLWIEMKPGPELRRLSLKKGVLTLHGVDQYWGAERYRRP